MTERSVLARCGGDYKANCSSHVTFILAFEGMLRSRHVLLRVGLAYLQR
jgi:hypothetical protein